MEETTWFMGADGFPTNEHLTEPPEKPMKKPYPHAMWRIDASYNDGLPFNMLLPGITGIDMWALERDNVIRIYDRQEPQDGFKGNGLAILHPASCISVHNDDKWDVTLAHPFDNEGKWRYLLWQNVLKINGQLFRIDSQKRNSKNGVEVHARHITCDLGDKSLENVSFPGGNAQRYLDFCMTHTIKHWWGSEDTSYKFDVYTDLDCDVEPLDDLQCPTLLSALTGQDYCLLNRGGELYRDNFYLSICKRMQYARDNAFYLRYSADMTEIEEDIDTSDYCTHLMCFSNSGAIWGVSVGEPEWLVHHAITKTKFFSYNSDDLTPEEDMAKLIELGDDYWRTVCSNPRISYKIIFSNIKNDPRYADFMKLQELNYGDSGTIYCPELDIDTRQKIVEIQRDELTGEIIRMTLGNLAVSTIRTAYRGNTVTSSQSTADKTLAKMRDEVNEMQFSENVPTPLETRDGLFLALSTGEYLTYEVK